MNRFGAADRTRNTELTTRPTEQLYSLQKSKRSECSWRKVFKASGKRPAVNSRQPREGNLRSARSDLNLTSQRDAAFLTAWKKLVISNVLKMSAASRGGKQTLRNEPMEELGCKICFSNEAKFQRHSCARFKNVTSKPVRTKTLQLHIYLWINNHDLDLGENIALQVEALDSKTHES